MSKITKEDGTIEYRNGKNQLHCEDGPAFIYPNGTKYWFQNDQLHRIDGPAAIYSNGIKQFWVNGERLSKEQFQSMKFRFINLCRR